MKRLLFFICILLIIPIACRTPKSVKFCYVKIAPFGISDVPLPTLYISMIPIDSIANINSNKDVKFLDQKILTDEYTLRNIIDFIDKYNSDKNYQDKGYSEFGCHNISIYDKNLTIKKYDLNLSESKQFVKSLIDMLVKNNLDQHVIEELKEEVLSPIDFINM